MKLKTIGLIVAAFIICFILCRLFAVVVISWRRGRGNHIRQRKGEAMRCSSGGESSCAFC